MEIYYYDRNRIYTGKHRPARLDPIDKKPLVPRMATSIKPPRVPPGFIARLEKLENGTGWAIHKVSAYDVYIFDPVTGELLDVVKRVGIDADRGNLKRNETLVSPGPLPAPKGIAYVYDPRRKRWAKKTDHRGTWINTDTMEAIEIKELGDDPPAGYTNKQIPRELRFPVWDSNQEQWVEDSAMADIEKAAGAILANAYKDIGLKGIDSMVDTVPVIDQLKIIHRLLWAIVKKRGRL